MHPGRCRTGHLAAYRAGRHYARSGGAVPGASDGDLFVVSARGVWRAGDERQSSMSTLPKLVSSTNAGGRWDALVSTTDAPRRQCGESYAGTWDSDF